MRRGGAARNFVSTAPINTKPVDAKEPGGLVRSHRWLFYHGVD